MVPIITDREQARKAGYLSDGRYFVNAKTGTAMYLPIWYGHRLDLENMLVTEDRAEIEVRTEFPDLNQLVKTGAVLEATIYRGHDIYPKGFPHLGTRKKLTEKLINAILAEFKEHGFAVTREALLHNYDMWSIDHKSGYRDEKNGYHLFTPCGCNPLSFRASSLEPELDWQETYGF